jgi:hypothetical protein
MIGMESKLPPAFGARQSGTPVSAIAAESSSDRLGRCVSSSLPLFLAIFRTAPSAPATARPRICGSRRSGELAGGAAVTLACGVSGRNGAPRDTGAAGAEGKLALGEPNRRNGRFSGSSDATTTRCGNAGFESRTSTDTGAGPSVDFEEAFRDWSTATRPTVMANEIAPATSREADERVCHRTM